MKKGYGDSQAEERVARGFRLMYNARIAGLPDNRQVRQSARVFVVNEIKSAVAVAQRVVADLDKCQFIEDFVAAEAINTACTAESEAVATARSGWGGVARILADKRAMARLGVDNLTNRFLESVPSDIIDDKEG